MAYMKIIIMCDSFKGTMTSSQVNQIIKESIQPYFVDHEIVNFPIADGGEGTLDAYKNITNAKLVSIPVNNPYFEPIGATYAIHGENALIELASAAGVQLISKRLNPMETTTFGVGQLINHAIESGAKHIMLGLGGSATNDAGCGIMSALGVRFYDKNYNLFIPVGKSLKDIAYIDTSNIREKAKAVSWTIVSDVTNPLTGIDGAAHVYARQKGANDEMIELLDQGLEHFAKKVKFRLNKDIKHLVGSGAAGGVGAGMYAFFDVKHISGIQYFIDLVKLKDYLEDAAFIITGEGTLDAQTLNGKVVFGIAQIAKEKNIDVYAVVGQLKDDIDPRKIPIKDVIVIHKQPPGMETIRQHAESDLRLTMQAWASNITSQ